ncbi:hypothetical protein HAX54_032340 [Datura stramonium]|uniref:C2H2-type domain-containing protein n=1 Tax=Datura stramonium TaxID=4076 RepID=A0ABS8VBB7_DATST|nr:hypothetical protein [Datura stramonium]
MVDYLDRRVGTGTLWIKLKISENDDVLEDHQDEDVEKNDDDSNDNRRRICDVCNKGFSSGKALGGHMRIHVQAAKKHLISGKKGKKLKPVVTRYYKKRILKREEEEEEEVDLGNYNNDRLLPTCSICGKNFPSMKSLFGHMRCHPERAWRGIQPPHLKSRDEMDKKTVSAITTTTVTVPGWSVTAKRGRKPNSEEATSSGLKDEEQLNDAVHHLMLLANGDSVESGLTGGGGGGYVNKHDDIPEELEKANSNSLTSKAENEEFTYHVSESKIIDNRKRRKKKMKIRFLDSVQDSASHGQHTAMAAAAPGKYKCNTCEKSFATHQALGGHKSSHNKFSMVIQNSDVTNVAATSEEAAATSSSKLLADSKLCYSNKINFTASRCQWGISPTINLHQTGPSSSQLTSPGEFSHTAGRRFLDFDLNELPPDHEDELAGFSFQLIRNIYNYFQTFQ